MAATKAWVNKAIEDAGSLPPGSAAPLNSPPFTGAPTAPTPVGGDDSTRLATTAFVQGELEDINERVDAVEDATTRIGGGPYAQVRRAVLLQGPLGAPVPTGSERAPQGLTRFTLSGVDYYVRLQRVAGDSYQANERMRWLVYQVGAGDGSSLALVGYTASLALGHQGAGAFVDGGKAYFLSAMTTDASHVGADAGRGFSVTEWKPGFDVTTQSDVTNYQVFGYAGSGHALERFYNGTAFNNLDNKYWFLITASEDDTNARWCVRYSSAAIIAAGPGGSLNVTPEYMFPLKVPSEERLHILQDGCADADTIYASRGHLNAFSRHRIERYDYQGNPGKDIDYDSVRREYGRALLLDHPTLGTPFALEPEGVCINGNEIETLITDTWRTGPDIVSFEGKNWAALQDGMLNRKPWLQAYWVETTKAATAGAWNDATTYNASLSGAYTKREMVVYGIKPSTSTTGEHPLDSGVMYAPGGASLRSGESAVDLQWVHGRTFQAKSFCMATNRYYEGFSYTGATLYLFDHSVDTADNTKKGRIGVNFSTGREYLALQATDFSGGASITVYGVNDSIAPGAARIFYGTGIEGVLLDNTGQTLFTAASGYTPVTAKRADSGNMFNASRGTTVYFSAYVSTTNAQLIARNGVNLAFATASTSDPAQTSTIRWRIPGATAGSDIIGDFLPHIDNTYNLGGASNRVKVLFAGTATINTSDERLKRDIEAVRDDLLDAWGAIDWCAYRWKDSYEEKGDGARWHFGLIAQRVRDAIDGALGEGSAIRMGIACYDEWEATPEIRDDVMETHVVGWTITGWELSDPSDPNSEPVPRKEAITEDRPTGETIVVQEARPAGNRWGLRYEECFAIEAAWTRRELAQLGGAARG